MFSIRIHWNLSNLPITRTKSRYLSSVKHCYFTPDFSNQFLFPQDVRKIGDAFEFGENEAL